MSTRRRMKRALHLDFHTLPEVEGIGERFDPDVFGTGLQAAGIEYVNMFAKCNLGYAYYPTTIGTPHPHLDRDLLGAVVDACQQRNIGVSAYLSLGLDHEAVRRHREWAAVDADGHVIQADRSANFFRVPCYRTGYADYFSAMVEEVLSDYPVDGIFCDNMGPHPCHGDECLTEIRDRGEDPLDPAAVERSAERARMELAQRVQELVGPDRYVIFNGVPYWPGRDLNTHMEVECLPGRWGYDFVEPTAALARTVYDEVLYMTGRFQRSWGDFGGYKGLDSLRHDLSDALALGIEFSVGDHLLPDGRVEPLVMEDLATLHQESQELREQLEGQRHLADTAVMVPADSRGADEALRGLGEVFARLSVSYDLITPAQDASPYDLLVVPDTTPIDAELAVTLGTHLDSGGAALVVGTHAPEGPWPLAVDDQLGERCYFQRSDLTGAASEMRWSTYAPAARATLGPGAVPVALMIRPWFENDYDGFHGHYYTPPKPHVDGELAAAVRGRVAQVSFALFSGFHTAASVAHVELVKELLARIQPDPLIRRDPSTPPQVKFDLTAMSAGKEYDPVLHVRTGRATPSGEMDVVLDRGQLPAGATVSVRGHVSAARVLPDGPQLATTPSPGHTEIVLPEIRGHAAIALRS